MTKIAAILAILLAPAALRAQCVPSGSGVQCPNADLFVPLVVPSPGTVGPAQLQNASYTITGLVNNANETLMGDLLLKQLATISTVSAGVPIVMFNKSNQGFGLNQNMFIGVSDTRVSTTTTGETMGLIILPFGPNTNSFLSARTILQSTIVNGNTQDVRLTAASSTTWPSTININIGATGPNQGINSAQLLLTTATLRLSGNPARMHMGINPPNINALNTPGAPDLVVGASAFFGNGVTASTGTFGFDVAMATAGGKVGIGTVSPSQLLTVQGGNLMLGYLDGSTGLMLQGTGGGNNLFLFNDSNNMVRMINVNPGVKIGDNSSTDIFILNDMTTIGNGTIAATTALSVYGVVTSSDPAPSISCSAGTGVLGAQSTSMAGSFVAGTAATSCTVTFASAWPKKPSCYCNDETNTLLTRAVATTTTLQCSSLSALTGDTVTYACWGAP